jgi:hypothetical protein
LDKEKDLIMQMINEGVPPEIIEQDLERRKQEALAQSHGAYRNAAQETQSVNNPLASFMTGPADRAQQAGDEASDEATRFALMKRMLREGK